MVGLNEHARCFRVAIIGCGGVSSLHAAAYGRHSDRVQVVATCDPLAERAAQLAGEFPKCRAFSSLSKAVAEAEWDVAVVCSPTSVRLEVVEEVLAAGRHVFVEKPLADNLDVAGRMVSAAEAAGVQLAVDQNWRYFYPFDLARSLIGEGRIGRPLSVSHRELAFRRDTGWRNALPRYALSVMGIHWFDGFRWMLGDEPLELWCETSSSPLSEAAGETDALVHATFTRGTAISYVESFSYAGEAQLDTIVIGESGSLRLRPNGLDESTVPRNDSDPEFTEHPNPYAKDIAEATFVALDQLLQAIESNTSPTNGGRHNLGSVAALEAAYLSAERGDPVSVASLLPA